MAATTVSIRPLPLTASAPQVARNEAGQGSHRKPTPLKQMRKGTKSCRECRRRKVKCNYSTQAELVSHHAQSDQREKPDSVGSIASSASCIECATHGRVCEIQGIVDNPNDGNKTDEALSKPAKRIYKRRRHQPGVHNSPLDSPESDSQEREPQRHLSNRPRLLKIHVNRMNSVAERLAQRSRDRVRRPVNPEILGMDAFDRIGAYDYVAAMNGVLHNYEAYDKINKGRELPQASVPTVESHVLLQNAFGHEINLKTSSPVLSQVFNNSLLSQTSIDPDTLISKFQVLTFADHASATDVDKLMSTIASEPYVMQVLDISTHWWISWRDQAFALHEVFLNAEYLPAHIDTSLALDSNVAGGTKSKPIPISLQDFVRSKLAQKDSAIAIATGLLGIAMSLQVLRPGIDDTELHLSCPPGELMDRIVLGVDSVVLSPNSNPSYMSDPSILLLLMARCKMYAEGNQVRKSFLTLRTAINAAKAMGFADPHRRLRPSQTFPGVPNAAEGAKTSARSPETGEDVTSLVVRQRFLGAILELDRLMSMVLGFPYYEDDNFTDHLALAVLKDEVGLQRDDGQPDSSNLDIKMRALRRVVAIIAGKINDRNVRSSSGVDDTTLLAETMNLQARLAEAAAAMPNGWWDIETHLEAIPTDPFFVHEHLMAQLWYWQTQAFLHLLFMLKPTPTPSHAYQTEPATTGTGLGNIDMYQENRTLCFLGCRGVLRIFNLMRSHPTMAVYVCNCDDLQGVLTGCILLVGMLMCKAMCPGVMLRGSRSLVAWPGQSEINESLALIEETKDLFRYRSQRQGGFISKQGLKVLIELGSFFEEQEDDDNDDQHHDYSDVSDARGRAGKPNDSRRRVVIMPYFGTINLEFGPSAIPPIRPYMDPMVAFDPDEFDGMVSAMYAPDIMAALPLTPPISSNGYPDGGAGGVAAASIAVESFSGHEDISAPNYSDYPPLDLWPLSSTPTSAWIGGDAGANVYANTGIGHDGSNITNNSNDDGMQFGFEKPDLDGLEWDQFLFGDELGQDWNVELPEWYTADDVMM